MTPRFSTVSSAYAGRQDDPRRLGVVTTAPTGPSRAAGAPKQLGADRGRSTPIVMADGFRRRACGAADPERQDRRSAAWRAPVGGRR
jgi:hypothetical protein